MKKYNEIDETKLQNLLKKNENSFSIPEGYFENLPGKIMDQIIALPDFETPAVINPFHAPEGYFETLPLSISEKIIAKKPTLYSWINNLQRPRIAIPIAFATVLFLAILFIIKQQTVKSDNIQEFTIDDLKNSTYIQCMDEDLFVDFISTQNVSKSDDSFEQYLIDNNIELTQIENKL